MSIHLQISSCNYPPSRQPLCPDLVVSFQHPYSRSPFNPSTAIPPPRGRTFILGYTDLFSLPLHLFQHRCRPIFLFPICQPTFRLHYRPSPSLRILPLLSRAFLKITNQTYPFHFIFTYRSFHSIFKERRGWKYLDIGETRLFSKITFTRLVKMLHSTWEPVTRISYFEYFPMHIFIILQVF